VGAGDHDALRRDPQDRGVSTDPVDERRVHPGAALAALADDVLVPRPMHRVTGGLKHAHQVEEMAGARGATPSSMSE
jgi:hypothetical protein